MAPRVEKKEKLQIAGIMGDGFKTAETWKTFEEMASAAGLDIKTSSPGYEVRFDYDGKCDCFVGLATNGPRPAAGAEGIELLDLPEREYAVFDVKVADGYDSENENMNKWLDDNGGKYAQATIDGMDFAVECYNEKFKEGIVEIWIPLDANNG